MIAYAMLYTVAVGLPVLLAALVVTAFLRRYGRPERGIWLGALALSFALPIVALLQTGAGTAPEGSPAFGGTTGVIGLPEVLVIPAVPMAIGLTEILLGAWLLGSVALGLRWMIASLRLARAQHKWRVATLDGVPVAMTDGLGPAVAGVLRPRVLVPPWLASMAAHRRSLVLLHEQEHIRAHDPWLLVASRFAPILTPWNPVVWILSQRLRLAIELDCDRRVLRQRPDVRAYGTTLLEVSSRDSGRLVAMAAFAESEAPLRNRILSMTTPSRTVSVVALLTSMVLGVVLMVAAFEIPIPTIRAEFEIGPDAEVVVAPEAREPAATAEPAAPPEPFWVRVDEPPSAEAELSRLRAERATVAEPAPPRTSERAGSRERVASDDRLAAEPTFTPFTLAPQLINLTEVQRALTREYPTVLRDAGIGGRVEVWFFIDAEGRVANMLLNRSSGQEALDQAALNVASIYRFSPAMNRDERVPVWVSLPITFQVR